MKFIFVFVFVSVFALVFLDAARSKYHFKNLDIVVMLDQNKGTVGPAARILDALSSDESMIDQFFLNHSSMVAVKCGVTKDFSWMIYDRKFASDFDNFVNESDVLPNNERHLQYCFDDASKRFSNIHGRVQILLC